MENVSTIGTTTEFVKGMTGIMLLLYAPFLPVLALLSLGFWDISLFVNGALVGTACYFGSWVFLVVTAATINFTGRMMGMWT